MQLPIPIRLYPLVFYGALAIAFIPASGLFIGNTQAADEKTRAASDTQALIGAIADKAANDEQFSILRAQTCAVIQKATPIREGAPGAKYSDGKGLVPIGTALCDPRGFTAMQGMKPDGSLAVVDVRRIAPEKLKTELAKRGL
jgi:hypothetical protein